MVQWEGFEWRPQNPNATEVDAQKWAWQGNTPGAWALLRLNTDLGERGGPICISVPGGCALHTTVNLVVGMHC